jgi:hypothetical protein
MAVWRDISLVWLSFLSLIAVLPLGAILYFAIKGMHRLRQLVRAYLPQVQDKARQVAQVTEQAGHRVAAPLIGAKVRAAQMDGLAHAIFRRNYR